MNRIKELRRLNGWTQTQLGQRIGAVKSTVSGYESETHHLDVPTIHALCNLFGCTADYLLCRSETPLPVISDADSRILEAFHAADARDQDYIRHLLHLDEDERKNRGSTAAS